MARRKKKKNEDPEIPQNTRHLTCRICKHLPESSGVVQSYGKTWGEIPEQAEELIIVGAPFFEINNGSSSRYKILQQCPHCGNFYKSEYDYEFLGTGFENDYSLVRLSDTAGVAWAKRNFATIYEQTPPEEAGDWGGKEKEIFKFEFTL